jgi:hypothetical protein
MKQQQLNRPFLLTLLFAVTLSLLYFQGRLRAFDADTTVSAATHTISLPLVVQSVPANAPLCRFGVNAIGNLNVIDLPGLRVGWYLNYAAQMNPVRPGGIEYMPVLVLRNYPNISLSDSQIQAVATANPGSEWLMGNEPDRPGLNLQDNLPPHKYAEAYHYYYHLIKSADPTARIIAGNIVQPTEVRLLYLDAVLAHYQATYGSAMPVDIWGFHNFILNEVSCDWDPTYCWGADTPTGMGIPYGEILDIDDNDRIDLFIERVYRFRQWLADRGYAGVPVYLSEYGVLMPADFGFPPSRVNQFMSQTFDFVLNERSAALGNPHDDYRLVQRLSWYSDVDTEFNGALFFTNGLRTPMGNHYAAYTAAIPGQVDFYPMHITHTQAAGSPTTVTLKTDVANSGNLMQPISAEVQFYLGNPLAGGTPIGQPQLVQLQGCGDVAAATVVWPNVAPGTYNIYVRVTAPFGVAETNTANNTTMAQIVITSP